MANSTFGPRGIFRNVSPFLPSAWFYTYYRILIAGTDERKSANMLKRQLEKAG